MGMCVQVVVEFGYVCTGGGLNMGMYTQVGG